MKGLFKKLGRDFKSLWPQFFSVFMMALLSLTIFSSMNAVWAGMLETQDRYFEETRLADIWVYGKNVTEERLEEIRHWPYVQEAEASLVFETEYQDNGNVSDIRLHSFNDRTQNVMRPVLRRGEAMNEETSGIWLDEDFAEKHNIQIYDDISLSFKNFKKKIKVQGLVYHSEFIYDVREADESIPDHCLHGYGYFNEKTLKTYLPAVPYNQIRIKLGQETELSQVKKDMEELFADDVFSVLGRKDIVAIRQLQDEIDQIKSMAILFSMMFVLLSLLTMYTTMSRLVNNQLILIGSLKALGFSRLQLYFHYGLYGFFISLTGGILGILIGLQFISDLLLRIKQSTLALPEWHKALAPETLLLLLAIVAICTLAALWTLGKAMGMTPTSAMRGEKTASRKHRKNVAKKRGGGYEWHWVIRDAFQNKTRYVIAVIAITGSMVLMVAGVGIYDTIIKSNEDVFHDQYKYSHIIKINPARYEKMQETFKNQAIQFFEMRPSVLHGEAQDKNMLVTVLEEGNFVELKSLDGNKIFPKKDEAIITKKLAREMHIREGDTISYQFLREAAVRKIKVAAISSAKMPQGLFLSKDSVTDFAPGQAYIGDEEALDLAEKQKEITKITPITQQRKNIDEMMESVNALVYILILASFLLSFVILCNLGMVSYVERSRQYATMKVLGFYKNELRSFVLKESLLATVPGYLLGIPASLSFLKAYAAIVEFDAMEWEAYISKLHFILISAVVLLFSISINLLIVRKIHKIKMVEALKSVDG